MARKSATAEVDQNVSEGLEYVFTPRPASRKIVRATKATEPNPLEEHVKAVVKQGPQELDVVNVEHAKRAVTLLRRAATDNGFGLKLKYVDVNGIQASSLEKLTSDVMLVLFEVTNEKRNRAYTADQIRQYAIERGYGEEYYTPKIHPDLRAEFKTWFNSAEGDMTS